jgi:hypothetical protein
MTCLVDLFKAVQTALAEKRLGSPVFVRYLVHSNEPVSLLPSHLAEMAAMARVWIGQPLDRLYALGNFQRGHAQVMLQFRGGASGLIGRAHGNFPDAAVDLCILGNHGALYFDRSPFSPEEKGTGGSVASLLAKLQHAIESSLRSGKPEAVTEEEAR